MRYHDSRWGARLGFAALALVVTVVLIGVAVVGGHGARPSESSESYPAARAQTTSPSARTPVPPMTGQQAAADSPEMTPTPTVQPVEDSGTGAASQATPQPAETTLSSALEDATSTPESDDWAGAPLVEGYQDAGSNPAPGSTSNEAQVRAAVEARWPAAEVERAMRVAYCESRFDPTAVEPSGDHEGVWQVDASLHGAVPGDIDSQTEQAYGIWLAEGWGPWSCR